MLKHILLAGVITIAAPALAQTQTNSVPTQASPATTAQPQAVTPTDAAPAADQTAATPGADATQTAVAEPAATGADQVASVVQTEFPTYDANKDGKLEKTEFTSWMVKLKQASDPEATATSPATKSWVNAAFAQADKDKSKSVTQPELIGFLSQGQS